MFEFHFIYFSVIVRRVRIMLAIAEGHRHGRVRKLRDAGGTGGGQMHRMRRRLVSARVFPQGHRFRGLLRVAHSPCDRLGHSQGRGLCPARNWRSHPFVRPGHGGPGPPHDVPRTQSGASFRERRGTVAPPRESRSAVLSAQPRRTQVMARRRNGWFALAIPLDSSPFQDSPIANSVP